MKTRNMKYEKNVPVIHIQCRSTSTIFFFVIDTLSGQCKIEWKQYNECVVRQTITRKIHKNKLKSVLEYDVRPVDEWLRAQTHRWSNSIHFCTHSQLTHFSDSHNAFNSTSTQIKSEFLYIFLSPSMQTRAHWSTRLFGGKLQNRLTVKSCTQLRVMLTES